MYDEDEIPDIDDINDEEELPIAQFQITKVLLKQTKNLVAHTENLVKQSKKLSCLTIALIVLTVILAVPAIWNLVSMLCVE